MRQKSLFNPLSSQDFQFFLDSLEFIDTHLRIQEHKKKRFPGQDISPLAVKWLKEIQRFYVASC